MQITSVALNALRIGFQTNFQQGLGMSESQYARIATIVNSSSKSETYGWLGKMPNVREWLGDRVVQNLSEASYQILNKSFELTIGVGRDDINDDNLGQYAPLFQEMGMSTQSHRDRLVFALLAAGFTTNCYDGQYFFDTDHPVLDEDGGETTVSNMTAGAETPWFLLSTKRPLKPIIFQNREDWAFTAMDNPTDENVFTKKEYQYGSDSRCNVGFGFYQMAHGSKAVLDAANYNAARSAMLSQKGDYARPLGIVPDLIVVPPSLEGAANKIVKSVLVNGGETNEWANTAEVLVCPWL